jgi:hypothetical protein
LLGLAILSPVSRVPGEDPPSSPKETVPPQYGYDPRPDFEAFNPQYRALRRKYHDEWRRLKEELIAQERNGRHTGCSRQVLAEAKWLVLSTARFDEAQKRLDFLRRMLNARRDPHAVGQVEADGSFGCCTKEWFLKLDNTTDELIALGLQWKEPKHPVKILERVNSPEKLQAYLDSVLIADVRKTGINTRTELNHSTSALTRHILWSGTLWEIPTKFRLDPGLRTALLEYQDDKWQDPKTGYWGTWYRTKDGLVKTADLSITFHLVTFREGKVRRWPEIIRTTLAFKEREYPYGWLEDGKMSNHHHYDVAALFRLGWAHANAEQKHEIKREIGRMLHWCLDETLEKDGSFKIGDESTLGGAFYFGVAFLNEVGYFAKANRFWTDQEFPEAAEVRDRIRKKLKELKLTSPEAQWAMAILESSK